MSTIVGTTHIFIEQKIPKFKGFDVTASDFIIQIDQAIEKYSDLLCYAKEVTDEKEKLQSIIALQDEMIKNLREPIVFYAIPRNWSWYSRSYKYDVILEDTSRFQPNENIGLDTGLEYGGKRARLDQSKDQELQRKMGELCNTK